MKRKPLRVGRVTVGGKNPAFILGPCVIESEKFVRRMAKKIAEICSAEDVDLIFKASYDMANRSSVRSFRGIGVREGCEILFAIGSDLKIPVTTDVHSPNEAAIAGEKINMLQIPAFLCRQTDLLRAVAETGRAINVKKGQFLAPWDVRNIGEKLIAFGNSQFCFTERGTTFGYNNLVADMRSLYWMREAGYRIVRRQVQWGTLRSISENSLCCSLRCCWPRSAATTSETYAAFPSGASCWAAFSA